MSDKSNLCVGCGRWNKDTKPVDLNDGYGVAPTCPDCIRRILATVPGAILLNILLNDGE